MGQRVTLVNRPRIFPERKPPKTPQNLPSPLLYYNFIPTNPNETKQNAFNSLSNYLYLHSVYT
jgi:hypothetical protein